MPTNATRLYPEASYGDDVAPKPEVAALGFSIQVDLGAGRVATMQTFIPNDMPLSALNSMLDKMTAAGDRQRAHYKIEELRRSLEMEQKLYSDAEEDVARLDSQFEADVVKRKAEMERMTKTLDAYNREAQDAHVASGRRGEFKRPAAAKTVETGIERAQEDLAKLAAERDVAKANLAITQKRRAEIIARFQAEIDDCEMIVGKRG